VEQHSERRDRLVGHLLRHESLLKTVNEGTVEGKMCRGRPRPIFIQKFLVMLDVRVALKWSGWRIVEGSRELYQTDLQIENNDDEIDDDDDDDDDDEYKAVI
jgi:hypothetical protein